MIAEDKAMDPYGYPLSEFELRRLENIKKNNEFLKSLGLLPPHDQSVPKYPKRVKAIAPKKKKNKSYQLTEESSSSSESSQDSDEDWVSGVSEETLKKRKEFQGQGQGKDRRTSTSTKSKQPRETKKCYSEAEVPDDDDYVFCEECQELHHGDCPTQGPLQAILDSTPNKTSLTAARASLPDCLEIKTSSIPNAGLGVFAKSTIPSRAGLGPYKGKKVELGDDKEDTSYMWEIIKDGKLSHFVDGREEAVSNWMRFVNYPRCESEQNLVAFQYRGQIFYRSYKEIRPGTELLVWYGDEYAKELGILDTDNDILGNGNSRKIQCKKCSKCFTSSNMLLAASH